MKPKADTYDNLVKHYNRDYSPFIECECGKYVMEKYMSKHKQTKLHSYLLGYKHKCLKIKQTEEQQNQTEQQTVKVN